MITGSYTGDFSLTLPSMDYVLTLDRYFQEGAELSRNPSAVGTKIIATSYTHLNITTDINIPPCMSRLNGALRSTANPPVSQ
jgi:hypothetical protein